MGLWHPLAARVVTGLVLIAVALLALWAGGVAWTALAAAAVLVMFAEWAVMFRIDRGLRLAGLAVVALGVGLASLGPADMPVVAVAGGAGLLGLFARRLTPGRGFWLAAGVLYCGLPGIALIWLRGQDSGFALTLWLLLTVWATDIGAFFAGRAIGGPKLAPAISPNKTWAGAVGGVGAAAATGALFGIAVTHGSGTATPMFLAGLAGLSVVFAVVAILGDLFESALKRRAGVKDSGNLLPGHGGVLDRLDGLAPVACLAPPLLILLGFILR